MNNEVRSLLKKTLAAGKEQERRLAELHNRIKKNNEYLYLEIYQQLVEQYLPNPIDYGETLSLTIHFRSFEFASEADKELINKIYSLESSGICLYNSPHKGEILVNVKDVIEDLVKDGFIKDKNHGINYRFAGWNEDQRKNDNVLDIRINLERFKIVMEDAVKKFPNSGNRKK